MNDYVKILQSLGMPDQQLIRGLLAKPVPVKIKPTLNYPILSISYWLYLGDGGDEVNLT